MTAKVEGQGVLDYEQEEAGILQATIGLPLDLSVEESGAIEFLGERIAQDGPFEALHLSCHGDFVKGHPVLALEKPEGVSTSSGSFRFLAFGEGDKKPKFGSPVGLPHRRARRRLGLCSIPGSLGICFSVMFPPINSTSLRTS